MSHETTTPAASAAAAQAKVKVPTEPAPAAEAGAAGAKPEVAAPETGAAVAEQATQAEDGAAIAGVEAAVATLAIAPQSELHRMCAEGRLDDVRSILGRGLDALETLDLATGCTPIVLAIQSGHVDVVRELLAAGAIVPPPGLTMDPVMLSVLYNAQPMYGVPPPFAQMGPPQFYSQPGFFPHAQYHRKDGSSPNGGAHAPNGAGPNGVANGAANLPPADVAKTIPCRNFPNCKYGTSCAFFHPRPQNPAYFAAAAGAGYVASGYEGFVPYAGGQPYYAGSQQEFVPSGAVSAPVSAVDGHQHVPEANGAATEPATPATPNDADGTQASHVGSAMAPAFVPGTMPVPMSPREGVPNGMPFGSPPAGYMGPMSPTLLPTPPPPMPSDAAFFPTSPPQFHQTFAPNGYPGVPGRRQSFGQFNGGGPPSKPYHGKKPSFSGGPKPWGPGGRAGGSTHLGQWKDGNPPPCAFFREGKCRNGEYCKFPHIDAEGNDVRHPDVVRGIIAPMPTRPTRVPRMMGQGGHGHSHSHGGHGHYDPALRHQQQMQFMQAKAAAGSVAEAGEGAEAAAPADKATAEATASLPPKPAGSIPPVSRSTSGAGGSRLANGGGSRAHSPNGTPAANGVRRGPRYGHQGNGSRSSSAGGAENKKPVPPQRVPRADEFPALGIAPITPSTERREPSWGKTAAQVLSEPAPSKTPSPRESPKAEHAEVKEEPKEETKDVAKEDNVVTMDSDSEQDAVIVSVSTTPNPETAKAKLPSGTVSFAAVAGTVLDAAPVALKA